MGIVSPGSPGMYDEEFYQALGPLADFHISNLPWANPRSPMTQALERAFTAAHPNNRFAADCFNAGFTFEAILVASRGRVSRAASAEGGDPGAYMALQLDRLDLPARPGIAFSLIKKLLAFNEPDQQRVEVVILSRNDPVSGMRIFRSVKANEIALMEGHHDA
jgi:hypothetical protein